MAVIWPEVLLMTVLLVERCNSEDTYLLPNKRTSEPVPLAAVTDVDGLLGDRTEVPGETIGNEGPAADNFPSPVDVTLASPSDSRQGVPDMRHYSLGSGSDVNEEHNARKPPGALKNTNLLHKQLLLKQKPAAGIVSKSEQDSSVSGRGGDYSGGEIYDRENVTMAHVLASTESGANTPRSIYIRGHLLRGQPPERTFHPAEDSDGYFRAPNSIHRTYIKDFRDEPTNNSGPSRQKRKHAETRKKFYNYKMLHDSSPMDKDERHKKTEFYAWIFGAAMLTLGTLTTMTSCFVFCFCGDKIRKRRQNRRRLDKSGEYQRVESVSSIVDNNDLQHEPCDDDEPVDNVTII